MKARVFDEWGRPGHSAGMGPAAAAGAPSREGGRLFQRAITGMLAKRLRDAELGVRSGSRMPGDASNESGVLRKGAEITGSAGGRAPTHPGRAGEAHCYADI